MAISGFSAPYLALPPKPCFISGNRPQYSKTCFVNRRQKKLPLKVSASYDRDNHDGKLVDEDMIVLRIRIHDIKMSTEVPEHDAPQSNWTEWEKRNFPHYDSDIYEAVGLLQSQLMNTRPSFTLGMLALVSLSVPLTTAALMYPLLNIFKGLLINGVH